MKMQAVTIVRIYITESSHLLHGIVQYLQKDAKIRGVSVFRAISGFGETGNYGAAFMDLSMDLPLAIEFFDTKDKVQFALEYLNNTIKPEHMVCWDAQVNSKG